ncbi:hypothetical protein PUNSTDRAFT_146346 [Punctularia strigosozonata HHB-11173 SS5]|uniref:FAD-binding PCMH-type domain-containing protein n=1 Tax=Punctularia strigosozonata (strain HHB-11173) TaxID=741275 RepID=R7S4C3_PUNST|nr:uncharacterized protein PUNSTDRAFT_146346 [Punctularia strigosozonata HHB-11173 SS5]EIN04699.1 hypothetical protein PUNSTDRAFT_146346 [Punctularia strigosozonata HHB-11173 SS5]
MSLSSLPEYAPFKDRNDESQTGLHNDELKSSLLKLIHADPLGRLNPLLTLLDAAEHPEDDFTDALTQAVAVIQKFNENDPSSRPDKTVDVEPELCLFGTVSAKPLPGGEPAIQELKFPKGKATFANWGHTIYYEPEATFVVRTIEGVCELVKWAAREGKKVRVAGFRHSWSELFGGPDSVLLMFLPYSTLVKLPYKSPPADWKTELSGATLVPSVADRRPDAEHAFVRIMAGTTNDQFRAWCYQHKTVCIPFNVIMVEITFGGSNAPICHGSGFGSSTLSDLVEQVEYVDARGNVQVVNDPRELRAASGCFGLLGVVVAITLRVDKMGVAEMVPVKIPMVLAVPPPKGYPIPDAVKDMIKKDNITEDQLEAARLQFIRRCKEDYYLEWFWFPYQAHCWVNTWKKRAMTDQDLDLPEYPGSNLLTGVKAQQLESSLAEAITNWAPWSWLDGQKQAYVFGLSAMVGLPNVTKPEDTIQTYVSEALHFRRGIQNFRCWDSEWEIPIPATADGDRDYELVQRAWWDGISAMYSRKDAPARVALEMRLTGSSNVLLAPQRGNANGTISIEVLTTLTTKQEDWQSFLQLVADKWTSYTDRDGNRLNARPHWAKQWAGLMVDGLPVEKYFTDVAYKDAFVEFRAEFDAVVTKRGGSTEETLRRFGNSTMERLIFPMQARLDKQTGSDVKKPYAEPHRSRNPIVRLFGGIWKKIKGLFGSSV